MGPPSTRPDRGLPRPQGLPLLVSIGQHTALVQDPLQKKRRAPLHAAQIGEVNSPVGGGAKRGDQSSLRQIIVGAAQQEIEIRACILVASRQRAIEDGEAYVRLRPQRPAKVG